MQDTKLKVKIVDDAGALAGAAAEAFITAARRAVEQKGSFTLALSGGSTPKALYSLLANNADLRLRVPWQQTYFFFGDERHVAPDHADSNYHTAHEAMLSKVPVNMNQVFRMKGEYGDAWEAAAEYEQQLRNFFHISTGMLPQFDLVLLGMGPDGHTASLFPGTKALQENQRLVTCNWVGKFYTHRITLTVPVLNNAASVLFLVHGEDKKEVLKAVLEGPYEPDQLPSQLINPKDGTLLWLVTQSAATLLDNRTRSTVAAV